MVGIVAMLSIVVDLGVVAVVAVLRVLSVGVGVGVGLLGMGARLERRQVLVIELLHTVRRELMRLVLELMLLRLLLRRLALAAVRIPWRHPVGGPSDVPNLSDQAGRQREKRRRHGWRSGRGFRRSNSVASDSVRTRRRGTAQRRSPLSARLRPANCCSSAHAGCEVGESAHAPRPPGTIVLWAWSVRRDSRLRWGVCSPSQVQAACCLGRGAARRRTGL